VAGVRSVSYDERSKTKKLKPKIQKPQRPIVSDAVVIVILIVTLIVIETDQNNVALACSFSLEKSRKKNYS
jgi:hypothetical protein